MWSSIVSVRCSRCTNHHLEQQLSTQPAQNILSYFDAASWNDAFGVNANLIESFCFRRSISKSKWNLLVRLYSTITKQGRGQGTMASISPMEIPCDEGFILFSPVILPKKMSLAVGIDYLLRRELRLLWWLRLWCRLRMLRRKTRTQRGR